jgi:hypothetical protein
MVPFRQENVVFRQGHHAFFFLPPSFFFLPSVSAVYLRRLQLMV